jgi:hypothetical protein
MPRQSTITDALVAEVAARRASGECWKRITADMRARGLPAGRTRWFLALVVHERRADCEAHAEECKA